MSLTPALRECRDAARLPELLRASLDSLFRLLRAWGLASEVAEEVVQETCCLALERRQQYRGAGPLFAWVLKIAYRQAGRRRRQRKNLPLPEQLAARLVPPEKRAMLREETQRVKAAMERLSERERSVLLMRSVEGLSGREIADVLEIPIGTVWSDLSRARGQLKALLGGAGDGL